MLATLTPTLPMEFLRSSVRSFTPTALLDLLCAQPVSTIIAVGFVLLAGYQFFANRLELGKPQKFLNIPRLPGFQYLLAMINGQSYVERYELARDILEHHGILRVPHKPELV
ncbi:hypothetical protein BC938DRAFT_480979 [Jimgerdemannia flammicorona]|uniref:Uncharacterized protein n=1 Tax=Jimgerdemannia flammicorona TaxID=994334 RepID=A0A433QH76_9FUNG|nr:hypothetical protein BC938DRAFT_480979 [Jimgerdemannia flammicorona]